MMNSTTDIRRKGNRAMSVDWVVLTAAVVALAGAAYTSLGRDMTSLSHSIQLEVGATDQRAAPHTADGS